MLESDGQAGEMQPNAGYIIRACAAHYNLCNTLVLYVGYYFTL